MKSLVVGGKKYKPYGVKEMRELVGQVVRLKSKYREEISLVVKYEENENDIGFKYWVKIGTGTSITPVQLLEQYEFVNGKPCGVEV